MERPIRFLFVCKQRFDDLAGDGQRRRECGVCKREVFNLDAMPESERAWFLARVANDERSVCVSTTQAGDEDMTRCTPPSERSRGPIPKMGTVDLEPFKKKTRT